MGEVNEVEYDARLQCPFTCIVAGPSQSGKTAFVHNLLRQAPVLFSEPDAKNNVIYYYKADQESFTLLKNENIVHHWVNEIPTVQDVQERTLAAEDTGGSIVIIDDFGNDLNKDIVELFTTTAHHSKASIILLVQNIFYKDIRTISLNAQYIFLFKNPRDPSQVSRFATQFAPRNSKYIVDAFEASTKRAHSYMLFDSHQKTPDAIRVKSRYLVHEAPMSVWPPSTLKWAKKRANRNVKTNTL